LANQITKTWPPEVDAWIDKLTEGEDAFTSASEALEALPMDVFDEDVLEKGVKALARLVARELKKAEKEAAKAQAEACESPASGEEAEEDAEEQVALEVPSTSDEYHVAIRQARSVMWACAALLFVAVAIELMRFGG